MEWRIQGNMMCQGLSSKAEHEGLKVWCRPPRQEGEQTEKSNDVMSPLTMLWMIKTEVLEV